MSRSKGGKDMSDLAKIGADLSGYISSVSPQVINGSLQWYLSGSLATLTMASAESITEIELDENNHIKQEGKPYVISKMQREKISKFSRRLGGDIDVVNVNGNFFKGASIENKPSTTNIMQNVPGVLDLMPWQSGVGSTMHIDNLDAERNITRHSVAKIKTPNGEIYITPPPEQLAHKLSETLWLSSLLVRGKMQQGQEVDYEKDIRDLATMFYGFKDLYENDELLNRIYNALNEKQDSIFSINNPNHNKNNAMQIQEVLDKYFIRKIAVDSAKYLEEITQENGVGIVNFLNSLMEKRRADIQKQQKESLLDER